MRWDTNGCEKLGRQQTRLSGPADLSPSSVPPSRRPRAQTPNQGKMAHRVLETGVIEVPQRAQPFRGQALRPNHIGVRLAGADQTIEKRPQLVRTWRGR